VSATEPPRGELRDRALLLDPVLAIARRASDLILEVYGAPFSVDFKEKDDPVTRADREANTLICAALEAAYPGVPIVAEESDPAAYAGYASASAAWFVDPLDGTREFVKRNGEFAVMIGLAEEGIATVGVIVCPATGRAFAGAVGLGAFEVAADGSRKPIHASRAPSLADAELLVSRSHRTGKLEELAVKLGFRQVTRCGSAGVKATRIACGEADVYAQPGRAGALWDACAPEALVNAAGGLATDAHGTRIDYAARELPNHHGFVATNGILHAEVIALLQRFAPPASPASPAAGPAAPPTTENRGAP
jgi:3'(2'), 5'-bisphosphate nucleotidase